MTGKVALVTGGAQGIGHAIVKNLSDAGAQLMIADIDPSGAELALNLGEHADFTKTDVGRPTDLENLIKRTITRFGQLDYLVNNAGVTTKKAITEMIYPEFQEVLAVNLSSAFYLSAKAFPYLSQQSGAAIVNIASLHAFATVPGLSAYAAAKGGMVALCRSQASEFAPTVRVNTVIPGLIETANWQKSIADLQQARAQRLNYHLLKRLGTPEDIAHAATFLLSDKAAFITGSTLIVDGGLSAQLYPGAQL